MRDDIIWHFREKGSFYLGILVVSLVFILICAVQNNLHRLDPIKIQEVQKWPSVEATIIESKFSFVSAGGRNSFRGTQQIELKIRYHTPDTGVEIETRVFGRWPLRQRAVKNDSFERGKTIKLRVNPGNPKQASLIELTGTV